MNRATNKLQLEENSVELIIPDLGSLFETIPVAGNLNAFSIGDALRETSESGLPSRKAAVTSNVAMKKPKAALR
jgi:hypothetical protein